MRVAFMVVVSILSLSAPGLAQGWEEYINVEDGFRVDFPGQPTITQTTFKTEYGADVPSRVYTYVRGPERYTIQVADYSQALGDAMKHGYLSDVKTLP